jgi:hypothetical protein
VTAMVGINWIAQKSIEAVVLPLTTVHTVLRRCKQLHLLRAPRRGTNFNVDRQLAGPGLLSNFDLALLLTAVRNKAYTSLQLDAPTC